MEIVNLNSENFKQEVLEESKTVLIDFWAEWCMPCKMMAPVVDEIAKERESDLKVAKVNIDENEDLAMEYNVMSIPTFIIIKQGKEVARTIGAQAKEEILKLL